MCVCKAPRYGQTHHMADNDNRFTREQKPSVLIPLDAEEAMLALQRFRRTGAGEAPFVLQAESHGRQL